MSIKSRRILSFLLTLTLIISTFSFISIEAYANCDLNLVGVKLTGNQAVDFVNVAAANEGRTGKQLKAKEDWCADFVYNCARKAKISESIIPSVGTVSEFKTALKKCGAKSVKKPKAGDLVFYGTSHVGIMADDLYAYQGNFGGNGNGATFYKSSKVLMCRYTSATNYSLYGAQFYRPNYDKPAEPCKLTITYNAGTGSIKSDKYSLSKGNICLENGKAYTDVWKAGATKKGGLKDAAAFGLYKKGYTFAGWQNGKKVFSQSDEKLTAEIIESKVQKENTSVTLTAKWKPNTLKITFNANGAKPDKNKYAVNASGLITDLKGKTVKTTWLYGEKNKPNELTSPDFKLKKSGYDFIGWSINKNANPIDMKSDKTTAKSICPSLKDGDSSIVLYACFIEKHDHIAVKDKAVKATCDKTGLSEGTHCSVCGKVLKAQSVISAKGHKLSKTISKTEPTCTKKGVQIQKCKVCKKDVKTYTPAKGHKVTSKVTKKATLKNNGTITNKCIVCGKKTGLKSIAKIKKVTLSNSKLGFNGKVQKPSVTVKDSNGKTLSKGKAYTVKYSNSSSKKIGKYTVTVTFKGKYSGTKKLSYSIGPSKVSGLKVKGESGSAALTYNSVKNADGYEVYFTWAKGADYRLISSTSGTYFTVYKLTSGNSYYFKVRAYKVVDGKKVFGPFSDAKKVKVK